MERGQPDGTGPAAAHPCAAFSPTADAAERPAARGPLLVASRPLLVAWRRERLTHLLEGPLLQGLLLHRLLLVKLAAPLLAELAHLLEGLHRRLLHGPHVLHHLLLHVLHVPLPHHLSRRLHQRRPPHLLLRGLHRRRPASRHGRHLHLHRRAPRARGARGARRPRRLAALPAALLHLLGSGSSLLVPHVHPSGRGVHEAPVLPPGPLQEARQGAVVGQVGGESVQRGTVLLGEGHHVHASLVLPVALLGRFQHVGVAQATAHVRAIHDGIGVDRRAQTLLQCIRLLLAVGESQHRRRVVANVRVHDLVDEPIDSCLEGVRVHHERPGQKSGQTCDGTADRMIPDQLRVVVVQPPDEKEQHSIREDESKYERVVPQPERNGDRLLVVHGLFQIVDLTINVVHEWRKTHSDGCHPQQLMWQHLVCCLILPPKDACKCPRQRGKNSG
mmetsp:Transcript_73777/g.192486  ORF Transcript_73777/g.192486 Transcript_73777/m.192486 type:complete len:445 (+) Transcript_73777:455-1789(+)